ncbi:MAG: RidA family protein [Rhodospirillaceae bacterium]
MPGKIETRLEELGIILPAATAPVANYVPFTQTGTLVFVSGQLPMIDGAVQATGLVGTDVSLEDAAEAARTCALNIVAQVKNACGGDLDRVRRVVKLTGFVAAGPDFTGHPKVINGASDTMVEIFGDAGRHARAAVGSSSLPLGAAVEVEAVFEIA